MDDEALSRPFEMERRGHRIRSKTPLIAAPMAGAIEPPYRMILHGMGIDLSYTEMISARGTFEGSPKTNEIADWVPNAGHSVAQIFGPDPEYLSFAAKKMVDIGHHMIDLNAGCPKRKVMSGGAGARMLRDPENLIECLSAIVEAVDVPVGIKTRSGYGRYDPDYLSGLLSDMEGTGLSYVALHPRTASQGFSGNVDRKVIDRAVSTLSVPVIASGDVWGRTDVIDYLDRGASGVMLARGLLGDPGLPNRIMKGEDQRYPGSSEDLLSLKNAAKRHILLSIDYYGERRGCIKFRTHIGWYLRGFPRRKSYSQRIHRISDREEALLLLDEIFCDWDECLGPSKTYYTQHRN